MELAAGERHVRLARAPGYPLSDHRRHRPHGARAGRPGRAVPAYQQERRPALDRCRVPPHPAGRPAGPLAATRTGRLPARHRRRRRRLLGGGRQRTAAADLVRRAHRHVHDGRADAQAAPAGRAGRLRGWHRGDRRGLRVGRRRGPGGNPVGSGLRARPGCAAPPGTRRDGGRAGGRTRTGPDRQGDARHPRARGQPDGRAGRGRAGGATERSGAGRGGLRRDRRGGPGRDDPAPADARPAQGGRGPAHAATHPRPPPRPGGGGSNCAAVGH